MRSIFLCAFVACCSLVGSAAGQMAESSLTEEAPLYYAVQRQAVVYTKPDSSNPYLHLRLREPVYVLEQRGNWSHIRTQDGARGFVASAALSNVWVRVSKKQRSVFLYRGEELLEEIAADLSYNTFSDKERRGSVREPDHWRTPEGVFFVVSKNPASRFYKALVLNYPTAEDAGRGLRQGIISKQEHEAIVRAEAAFAVPPMNTALGGMIEIHGHGTGARSNWTQGCIAVRNDAMDRLWRWVAVGTPVVVEP